jgi:ANTAR domain/GAF domain
MRGHTAVVAELAQIVAGLDGKETETAAGLRELVVAGLRHVAGTRYAGLTRADKAKAVSNVVATHHYAMILDAIQNRCGEGPSVAAASRHPIVHIDDLNAEERWPRFRRKALDQTPIRSVLSYEVLVDGRGRAALNFYADRPHAFTDDSLHLGGVFATHIALAWSMLRRQDQFRAALASRDTIGQAKGVLMERFDLDAVEAFDLLTRLSQQSNTRVIDIAGSLIESEHPIKRRQY